MLSNWPEPRSRRGVGSPTDSRSAALLVPLAQALPHFGTMPVPTTPNPDLPPHPVPPMEQPKRHIHDPDPWQPPAPVEDPPAQPEPQVYN